MSSMPRQIIRSLSGAALLPFRKPLTRNALTVFVYHDVSDHPSEFSDTCGLNIPPAVFSWQCGFIKKQFNVISPDDLLGGEIPPYAALITFDDGFESYRSNALPILEYHEMPSIIFLNMEPVTGSVFWAGLITWLCRRADFIDHVRVSSDAFDEKLPAHLFCSRELVEAYLEKTGLAPDHRVKEYVGAFISEEELELTASHPLVFYGNHLFNHHVPKLMSDEDLLDSYLENERALQRYPNYRKMFAFPYGKPGSCFTERQIELLTDHGAEKVFSTYPTVNHDASISYLHRIPLHRFNDSRERMWFHLLRRSIWRSRALQ